MRDDGLYRHGHLCDAAWGRGNGFPAVGIAWCLTLLPTDHPGRDELLAAHQRHLVALVKHQTADGLWRQVIDVPDAYEEFSATAMIGFAIQRGISSGWLEQAAYQSHVDRAWGAICQRIQPGGKLLDVCEGTGTQKSLEDYLKRKAIRGADDRGGAMALLFAVERVAAK
jgi:rhamnogalacturonyl hydrolase YesR